MSRKDSGEGRSVVVYRDPRENWVYIPRSVFNLAMCAVMLGGGFAGGIYAIRAGHVDIGQSFAAAEVTPRPQIPALNVTVPAAESDNFSLDNPFNDIEIASPVPAPDVMESIPAIGERVEIEEESVAETSEEIAEGSGSINVQEALESISGAQEADENPSANLDGSISLGGEIDVNAISNPAVRDAVAGAIRNVRSSSDPEEWAQREFGYVPKLMPGEHLPSISESPSADAETGVSEWEFSETEGSDVPPAEIVTGIDASLEGDLVGNATVISPNTVAVNDFIFRISDVVTPGISSSCKDTEGLDYDCLSWAVTGLGNALNGKRMVCVPEGSAEDGTMTGSCEVYINDNSLTDVGSWMVFAGLGLAAPADDGGSSRYAEQELEAKNAGRGVWSGTFEFGGRSDQN